MSDWVVKQNLPKQAPTHWEGIIISPEETFFPAVCQSERNIIAIWSTDLQLNAINSDNFSVDKHKKKFHVALG